MPLLNPSQSEAVAAGDGPLLILAGAGAGKTHTLTARVVAFTERGVRAENILCVTFTNKAAREMRERIARGLGQDSEYVMKTHPSRLTGMPMVGTFHSLSALFLRRFAPYVGYSTDFTISDEDDKQKLVKEILKDLKIDDKSLAPRQVISMISEAKNQGIRSEGYRMTATSHITSLVADVYREYERRMRESSALDFDDLLLLMLDALQVPEVLEYMHERYTHIMVDEYQDTNEVQYRIVKKLALKTRNLTVVGDDWQGIYSWRGANIKNILSFQKDYPDAQVIKLEQNYRSTKVIISAANALIRHNPDATDKTLWTDNDEGGLIDVIEFSDEKSEAHGVISRAVSSGDVSQWCILYRTNAQSRAIEEACIRANIPYRIYGGQRFYDRKEVKDMMSYLRLVHNDRDLLALSRVINVPWRKIGDKSWDTLRLTMDEYRLWVTGILDVIDEMGITGPAKASIASFANWYVALLTRLPDLSVSGLIASIVDGVRYYDYLRQEYGESESVSREENVRELMSVASRYDGQSARQALGSFLDDIALITSSDEGANDKSLTMMTIHTSKGLEFPSVAIVGAEESIFPHSRTLTDPNGELLEERRLMYVAMTRARHTLMITRARSRVGFGGYQENIASRFIRELPPECLRTTSEADDTGGGYALRGGSFSLGNTRAPASYRERLGLTSVSSPAPAQQKKGASTAGGFSLGDRIEHTDFGIGTIVMMDGPLATIAFAAGGMKKLHTGIAPIRRVG